MLNNTGFGSPTLGLTSANHRHMNNGN
jgi:hypothetical protein